ncbi:PaaI family thioesterase [Rhodoblastus sp.]|uniref:PaaI family thioesterase n=1 Tax=Rhodoblastus sp. TaxID=1962975 RepID=UPI0035B4596E
MTKSALPQPIMTVDEIEKLLDEVFPQLHHGGRTVMVEAVGSMTARLRLIAHERHLRPGGTVSGPAMFTLADVGIWVAILAHMGPGTLGAVTSNLNINFLLRPPHGDVIVECRLLKLGKRLAVGEATLFADGSAEPVAHAVGTYAIPAAKK